MLQLVVCVLNWECLGHPRFAPLGARAGAPTTVAQQRVLDHLESQLDHLLSVPSFAADDLGRAADKLASLSQVIKELPRDNLRDVDLLDWAASLHSSFFPYEHPKVSKPPAASAGPDHASCPREAVSAPQQPVRFINFRSGAALPVIASRIKWSSPPSFDPTPYLDPVLEHAFANPEFLRKPEGEWPKLAPARIHCSRAELLKLGELWDKMGSVRITPAHRVDWDEAVGIFAVAKSAARDRLIINPCVANSRSHSISRFSKSLAPGCLLTMLSLEPHLGFRIMLMTCQITTIPFRFLRSERFATACGVFSPRRRSRTSPPHKESISSGRRSSALTPWQWETHWRLKWANPRIFKS